MTQAESTGADIRHVLLDVGVVLLHLEYDDAVRQALQLCDPDRAEHAMAFLKLLGRTNIVDRYERGEMSATDFYDHFVRETGFRGAFDQFARIWRSIFRENKPMIDFAWTLKPRFPIYLLTNASDLHVPWVFEHYPRLRFFEGYASSFDMKATKPERLFYERAIAHLKIDPSTCLFVDDRPDNVEAAEAFGIRSILYTEAGETIMRMSGVLNLESP